MTNFPSNHVAKPESSLDSRSAQIGGFRSILAVGIAVLASACSLGSVKADSSSDVFRDLTGAHIVKLYVKRSTFQDEVAIVEEYETSARLWVPYRKGRVNLRATLGTTDLFIEGQIYNVRTKRTPFRITKIIHTNGSAIVRSGPANMVGTTSGFGVSALAYKGKAFPWGVFYISNNQGESLFGEFEHPGLRNAYRRSDKIREIELQRLNAGEPTIGRF